MDERLKQIRKNAGLTQEAFGEKLGMTRGYIAQIEMGMKSPSDRMLRDICRQFRVNEDWLRTGAGDPYIPRPKNQQIADFMNSVMEEVDESIKKNLILALSKLDESDWEVIEKIARQMAEKNEEA